MVINLTINHNQRTEQIAQKEKSHVVDYHRNSINPMAARLFRSQYTSKFSANGRLDPYSDRHRGDPRHFAPVGDHVNPYSDEKFCPTSL